MTWASQGGSATSRTRATIRRRSKADRYRDQNAFVNGPELQIAPSGVLSKRCSTVTTTRRTLDMLPPNSAADCDLHAASELASRLRVPTGSFLTAPVITSGARKVLR